ncbi:MAG TPA: hypothetical protein PLO53_09170 [Candidatus Hydrogenedentes bacterium]|nr:hypothetical protein [Candidatus Hydrogenedentota bacterium]HPU98109.1 hypothetical protein [Candidatus Hydrogenedentota bacterium]
MMRNVTVVTALFLVCLMVGFQGSSDADSLPGLALKAKVFQADMERRFLLEGQALCKLKPPRPNKPYIDYNMPDNAYMTGMYLGALSMKYRVTGDEADRQKAMESLDALIRLSEVSGEPGLLARAFWPADRPMEDDGIWRLSPDGRYRWRGDVSTDQMAGAMFGFFCAWEYAADGTQRDRIGAVAAAMVERIERDGRRIRDVDGSYTRWGRYDLEYVSRREKMNALLYLQVLAVAARTSGRQDLADLYRRCALEDGYAGLAVEARRLLDPTRRAGMVNHSDDVLLFLAYFPLLTIEQDPELRNRYLDSFRRFWNGNEKYPGVKPEANPLYAFSAAAFLGDKSGIEGAVQTLRLFPFRIKWSPQAVADYAREFGFEDVGFISPYPLPGAPIPIDRREKCWSAWVQDPYHSPWRGEEGYQLEFNGHDYLLAYWLGRHLGLIAPQE